MVNGFPELVYKAKQDNQLDLGPTATALELLQAVYRSPSQELHTRMRAAALCLPFETPKLGVSFIVNDADIAARLDKAIERTAIARANGSKVIEAQPIAEPAPAPTERPSSASSAPASLNRLYDKRHWRRF